MVNHLALQTIWRIAGEGLRSRAFLLRRVWQPRHSPDQRMLLANSRLGAHQFSKTNLSKTVKHHWYGDTSPWTEQRLEDNYGFKGPQSRPAAKVVILDQENPPQPRSARSVESED